MRAGTRRRVDVYSMNPFFYSVAGLLWQNSVCVIERWSGTQHLRCCKRDPGLHRHITPSVEACAPLSSFVLCKTQTNRTLIKFHPSKTQTPDNCIYCMFIAGVNYCMSFVACSVVRVACRRPHHLEGHTLSCVALPVLLAGLLRIYISNTMEEVQAERVEAVEGPAHAHVESLALLSPPVGVQAQ